MIGGIGGGDDLQRAWFIEERLGIAARCIGAMWRLLDETVDWAIEREQGGSRIFDYQGVSFPLADSAADAAAGAAADADGRRLADAGADPKLVHDKASMAKLFASEAAWRCADRCVQAFGGRGYLRSNVAERLLRELRVDRIWEGTSEIQRLIIARGLERRGVERMLQLTRPAAARGDRRRPRAVCSAPRSIAVVGATDRAGSYGDTLLRNLERLGFDGEVWGVNPNRERIREVPCVPALADLPEPRRRRRRRDPGRRRSPAVIAEAVDARLRRRGRRLGRLRRGRVRPRARGASCREAALAGGLPGLRAERQRHRQLPGPRRALGRLGPGAATRAASR